MREGADRAGSAGVGRGDLDDTTNSDGRSRLPVFAFDRRDLSREENVEVWRSATAAIFDVDVGDTSAAAAFYADMRSYAMGTVLVGQISAAAQRFSRSTATIARSGIDHIVVQLYLSGGFVGVAGGVPIEVGPGDVCVLDCADTCETRATDFTNLTFVVPRAMMEAHLPKSEMLHGLVLPSSSALTQILSRHMLAIVEMAPRMTLGECEAIARGTVSLMAACLRGELEERAEATGEGTGPLAIRVRRHIDERLADRNLGVESIADHFGVSRASLYRLFEPFGGVADHIRNKRLRRALFDLTSPQTRHQRIGEIARRWGFNTEGTFTRAFRSTYGIAPSTARDAAARRLLHVDRGARSNEERETISRWMREIGGGAEEPGRGTPQ